MLSRFSPLAAACALVAMVLPAAASAATVDVQPLASVASGVGLRNGDVYVVQPQARRITAFLPDTGAVYRDETLPGDPGAATSVVEAPGRAGVWIGIGSGADRGFATMNDSPGVANGPSTAGDFGCGPVGMASDQTNRTMIYAAPLGAAACGTHGAGIVSNTGSTLFTDPTFPDAYDLQWVPGKLFVPAFDEDQLRRYTVTPGALTLAATAPLPAGSEPDGVTVGDGGQIYATLHGTGKVVKLAPDAADGTAPTVVADGLDRPVGIAADPFTYDTGMGPVYVADSGSGRVLRIDTDGTRSWIDLPAGFEPGQIAVKGTDIWVTDLAAARIAHIQDTGVQGVAPSIGDHVDVDPATGTVSVAVDPGGSPTMVQFITDNTSYFADWSMTGPARTVSLKLTDLVPGSTHTVYAMASNRGGQVRTARTVTFTYLPATTPPVQVRPPVVRAPKPKAPTFTDLVRPATAKRCVANRHVVLLTLRRQPAARTIASVTVRVGKGKSYKYLARQLKHGLRLRRLPARGSYKVAVTVRLASGKAYKKTLTYKACKPRRR